MESLSETVLNPKSLTKRFDMSTFIYKETRIKLTPVSESEKPQLQRFCNACKGIPQVTHSAFPFNNQASVVGPPQTTPEDPELALAITASLQSSSEVGLTAPNTYHGSSSTTPSGSTNPTTHNIDNNKKTQWDRGCWNKQRSNQLSSPLRYQHAFSNCPNRTCEHRCAVSTPIARHSG
ncbi:hypothetical protein HanPSC8_Chr03g0106681 [Helianthus annuus]|nr:hypothetical protein HanHA89_Chr03g0103731 [Helianthus annuus]KAJ0943603.1 hypothetical protein HanPSC8_Chr03g0106681 [Helianthus annuus]